MENILIISANENLTQKLEALIGQKICYAKITIAKDIHCAKKNIAEKSYDLSVVDSSLILIESDFLAFLSQQILQIIYLVDRTHNFYEELSLFTLNLPLITEDFFTALHFASIAFNKINQFRQENTKLQNKIEQIKRIDRAKCLLVEHLQLSEAEAHRFIEKQAMDLRLSRGAFAEKIIEQYKGSANTNKGFGLT
ncbi:MAG: ANTAR domain-containing response regulator [Treponemataceae bacterium]